MGALGAKLRTLEGGRIAFWCPGCNESHHIVRGRWTFNENAKEPTFSPSILVKQGHFVDGDKTECWCTYNREHPGETTFRCLLCHSFVREGRIQFLDDSSHALAGQTVDLPDFPGNEEG